MDVILGPTGAYAAPSLVDIRGGIDVLATYEWLLVHSI